VIPYENTCEAEKPFCNGYVEKKNGVHVDITGGTSINTIL
jgi:hypothetical protein